MTKQLEIESSLHLSRVKRLAETWFTKKENDNEVVKAFHFERSFGMCTDL